MGMVLFSYNLATWEPEEEDLWSLGVQGQPWKHKLDPIFKTKWKKWTKLPMVFAC